MVAMDPGVRRDDKSSIWPFHTVIASEPKQSRRQLTQSWIASSLTLLAMTRRLPRLLRRLTAALARRLIRDARVMCAIGEAGEGLVAAEEEFRHGGVASRPVGGTPPPVQQPPPPAH